jgi:hypothetical protein
VLDTTRPAASYTHRPRHGGGVVVVPGPGVVVVLVVDGS